MPARTGRSTYVPGRGTTTRSKSGKAKTFSGKGPAPSGTKKVAEPTAATAPTVTVSPTGSVSTSGFRSTAAAQRARARQRASARRTRRITRQISREERKATAAALASVSASRRRAQERRATPPPRLPRSPKPSTRVQQGPKTAAPATTRRPNPQQDPAQATISSKPRPIVTRQERRAARVELQAAKKAVRRSLPDLSGLSPEERRAAKLNIEIGPKYDIPPSVLMSQQRQESGFNPAAVSSAGAQGISQFIPSTAASYGVEYGTGRKEVRSQIRGQAKLLRDSGFATDPKGALMAYTGGYSDSEYNNPVLEGAADYKALDRPGDPKVRQRYREAVKKAKSLGMKVGKPPKDIVADPKTRTVKVRADAKGAVDWAKSQVGHVEGDAKTMRWGAKYGLNPVTEPWCANFISNDLARRGIKNLPSNPNYVPSYEDEWGRYSIGSDLSKAKPGDLITYSGEHIAMYIGNGQAIGGNQSDSVTQGEAASLSSHPISMIIRPPYKGGWIKVKESTSLPGTTSATGTISSSSGPAILSAIATPGSPGGGRRHGKAQAHRSQKQRKPLTTLQRYNRNKRKLKAIGAPLRTRTASSRSESHPILEELKEKYGSAAPSTSERRQAALAAAAE